MIVTVELDDDMLYAIARKKGIENGYDWGTDPQTEGDLNERYAMAFEDGMRYIIDLLEQPQK